MVMKEKLLSIKQVLFSIVDHLAFLKAVLEMNPVNFEFFD